MRHFNARSWNEGAGTAHNNMARFTALTAIIKT